MNGGAIPLNVFTALTVLVFVVSIGLIVAVMRKGQQHGLKVQFSIAILSFLIFSLCSYVAFLPQYSAYTTLMSRLSIAAGVVMNFIFFTLLDTVRRNTFYFGLPAKLYALYSAIILPLCFSPLIFVSSTYTNGHMSTVTGPLMPLFALHTFISCAGGIYLLFWKNKTIDPALIGRVKMLSYGFVGMYLGFIFTIVVPVILTGNSTYVPFGALYILLFLFIVAVCAIRYELFSLRLVSVEVLVFALNVFLLFVLITAESATAFRTNFAVLIFSIFVSILLVRMARSEVRLEVEHTRFAAIEESNQKLRALDLQKSEFLELAAHHLRTPLSVIGGYLDLLISNSYGKITKETKKVLENMEQNNSQLVHLVDEFLDISSIEQRKINYKMAEFDLNVVISEAVKELQIKADQKDIQIVWHAQDEAIVLGDAPKIKHAFYNILDNAIKYSKNGKVFVSVEEDDGGFSVHIVDNGPGFAPDDRASLFEKFYRGKNIEKDDVTGTGLGLYVCKKYIEAHKGKVWAESAGVGKGAEFGFWIPAK